VMPRKALVPGVLLLLGLVILLGYSGTPKAEPWSETTTYFFSDRSDQELEYIYAIRDREVVVQVADFPGYSGRKWYSAQVPDKLLKQVKSWETRRGDITPPFEPHGPWYCRIEFAAAKERERGEAWFRNDNKAVESWFELLRSTFVTGSLSITRLPRWIEEDERCTRMLGL